MNIELKDSSIQVLNENLTVLFVGDEKVVFAFKMNFGFIEGKILFVKEEFFPGGKKHNAFFDQYSTLLKQIYQLEAITTESQVNEMVKIKTALDRLLNVIAKEKDLTRAQAMVTEADRLYQQFPTQTALDIVNKIKEEFNALSIKIAAVVTDEIKKNTEEKGSEDSTAGKTEKDLAKKKDPVKSKSKAKPKKKSGKKAAKKKTTKKR